MVTSLSEFCGCCRGFCEEFRVCFVDLIKPCYQSEFCSHDLMCSSLEGGSYSDTSL